MSVLTIQTPRKFLPFLGPARYKAAHGGRMGMKSHFFAELLIERCLMQPTRAVCIREIQRSIKESVKLLLEDKIKTLGVDAYFDILTDEIRGKNGSLIIFRGMRDYTAANIKSLEGFDIAWWEEAQTASHRSLELLRPTIIRKESAEMWFTFNPDQEDDPIERLLRGPHALPGVVLVETTYKDNPYLSKEIIAEIEAERERDPDNYLHVWMGHHRRTLDGSVYAKEMRELYSAKEPPRVTRVLPIPGKPVDTFWDLGKRDHTAIWFAQMQMGEYRILDFYQNRGEKLEHYADEVRKRAYTQGAIWLPHDANQDRLVGKTIAQAMRDLFPGVTVRVLDRMSKKAIGHDAVRRIMPNCYFDEERTKEGRKCLERYRYDVDPDTGGYSQNPLHDEYSDGADAFAQLALSLKEPIKKVQDLSMPEGMMAL